jgi:hypothetical protein
MVQKYTFTHKLMQSLMLLLALLPLYLKDKVSVFKA